MFRVTNAKPSKKQIMALRLLLISLGIFFNVVVYSKTSPFNDVKLNTDVEEYTFVVSGHFFGETHNESGLPTNTLLANIDWLNNRDHLMLITLGDVFRDVTRDPKYYESTFFSKLKIPMFNAVGNHDLTDDVYQKKYGKTHFYFFVNDDCHIILDTEMDNSDIEGDQLKMLEKAVKDAKQRGSKNLFVYGHRTIWSRNHPEMKDLFQDNTQAVSGNSNFIDDVRPVLDRLSTSTNIYCFAGSLGKAPSSFFYHKEKGRNLYYICSAIRGLNHDAMLRVHRSATGKISFETYSLTGNKVKPLEEHNLDVYMDFNPRKPFNWRLVPLYIFNMVTNRYFYYGILWTLFGVAVIFWWVRRRRKKISAS